MARSQGERELRKAGSGSGRDAGREEEEASGETTGNGQEFWAETGYGLKEAIPVGSAETTSSVTPSTWSYVEGVCVMAVVT